MSEPRIAAIHYTPGQSTRPALDAFIAELTRRGVVVHGLVQEATPDHGIDAIDINTGQRIALKRPTRYELDNKLCSLNLSQLAEATMILRRALDGGADVVVVERFGKTERDGGGLADDLLALMASGTPTLVTVPEDELEAWNQFSGGLGAALDCRLDALIKWWDGD
jgi:hypothetical protein